MTCRAVGRLLFWILNRSIWVHPVHYLVGILFVCYCSGVRDKGPWSGKLALDAHSRREFVTRWWLSVRELMAIREYVGSDQTHGGRTPSEKFHRHPPILSPPKLIHVCARSVSKLSHHCMGRKASWLTEKNHRSHVVLPFFPSSSCTSPSIHSSCPGGQTE